MPEGTAPLTDGLQQHIRRAPFPVIDMCPVRITRSTHILTRHSKEASSEFASQVMESFGTGLLIGTLVIPAD